MNLLFRYPSIMPLIILLSINAFANITAEKEAEKFGYDFITKMMARCNGLSYLKSAHIKDFREYRGSITISLHEPASNNVQKDIEWAGSFEINAPKERMHSNREGWTHDIPMPLLFTVEKRQGRWLAKGLQKASCEEVQALDLTPKISPM